MTVFRPCASAVDGLVIHRTSAAIVSSRMREMVNLEKLIKGVKEMKIMMTL